jgi:hypothetical protein
VQDVPDDDLPGGGYAKSMYQPAALVLTGDLKVLFEYVAEPGIHNMGGASPIGRPKPECVMKVVREYAAALAEGTSVADKDRTVYCEPPMPAPALVVFVPLILFKALANGNFIYPKLKPTPALSYRLMNRKMTTALAVVGFAAWTAPLPTLVGLTAYGAYVYFFCKDFWGRFYQPSVTLY